MKLLVKIIAKKNLIKIVKITFLSKKIKIKSTKKKESKNRKKSEILFTEYSQWDWN